MIHFIKEKREQCGEARAESECFSHFSSVLNNSQVMKLGDPRS